MAKLTLVERPDDYDIWGKFHRMVYEATGSTTYPTGGYPIVPADVGGGDIRGVRVLGCNAAANKLLASWDYVNKKFLVSYPTGGATAAPAALAAPIVTTGASTASAVDATTPNITPGQGKELLNNTNLTTCKWLLEVITL